MEKLRKKNGFTMAELLIVVAIIAILVAISIPVFTGQLEKARESTDAANIRNAISQVSVDYLNENKAQTATVKLKQEEPGWNKQTTVKFVDGSGKDIPKAEGSEDGPQKGGECVVAIDDDGKLTLNYSAGSGDT